MKLKARINCVLNVTKNVVRKTGSFLKEQGRLFMIGFLLTCFTLPTFADASAGVSGFQNAEKAIVKYQDPVQKLMYAIAAVIAIVGAFNVYFKMQNGDQDVKKTIMMTVGGCVAMVIMATCLPLFFK